MFLVVMMIIGVFFLELWANHFWHVINHITKKSKAFFEPGFPVSLYVDKKYLPTCIVNSSIEFNCDCIYIVSV